MQIETIRTKRTRRKKLTRVAAYCRVSDDNERLMDSLEAQKKHYEDLIPAMPGTGTMNYLCPLHESMPSSLSISRSGVLFICPFFGIH